MKSILFILPSLQIGGLEYAQVNLANALVRRGYGVTVMTYEIDNQLRSMLDDRIRYIHKPARPHRIMKRIPYIRHKYYDDGMWETRASSNALYRYFIGQDEYDVEVAYFRGLPIKIISGSTNKCSRKIAFVHSDFEKCQGITNQFQNLQAAKDAYSSFDKIVCVSNKVKDSFQKVIGCSEKTVTINNIIPVNRILKLSQDTINIRKNGFTIVTVGHIIPLKGHERLINVVRRLREKGKDISLWIIGDGTDRSKLESYVKENHLNSICFIGMQDNPYKYLSQGDLYVCSSFYEGFPLTVCEAIVCGLPVLSTDCAGACEILGNGEFGLIVENSEEGLFRGISGLLDDEVQLQHYRGKAKERIAFFDEQSIVNQFVSLF